jgi:predicted porin
MTVSGMQTKQERACGARSFMGFQCTAFSKMGIYTVKRSLISAIALGGLMVSAQAADLSVSSVKDAVPAVPDGPITWMGVTFYGTIDVGYAYVHNGTYPNGAFYEGAGGQIFGSPFNHQQVSTLNDNALSLSNVGIKIEEQLGYGFLAIGKLQTDWNPISGELADACASLLRNSGRSLFNMDNNGDGSRCGQAFSNAAYGGVSHPLYGTLTAGRQYSLVLDGMSTYDPMALSQAFSLIGYSGTAGGGVGSTEDARWDNSVKYIFTYGPFHAAGMYTNGGQDTPMVNDAYGANAGVTYMGFSVDGFYTKENGAVNLNRLPLATNGILGTTPLFTGGPAVITSCDAALGNCPNYLLGTITDNEAWDVMAKYTFNVPSFLGATEAVSTKDAPCGGLKDAPCPVATAKVTLYGGYQHVDQSNPGAAQFQYSGNHTIGGYQYVSTGLLAFGSDRIRETAWAGVSYEDGPWKLVGAWYFLSQNSFLSTATGLVAGTNIAANTCAGATLTALRSTTFVGTRVGSNCSGDLNQGSFLIDYTFNRHLDLYAGVTFMEQTGGLNSGFLEDNIWEVATGLRLKW